MSENPEMEGLPESLENLDNVTRVIVMGMNESHQPVFARFFIRRSLLYMSNWIVGLEVWDYDLGQVRGQEIAKRAFLKLGVPAMHELAGRAVYRGAALYRESFVDVDHVREGTRCSCEFMTLVHEYVARILLDKLKANGTPEERIDRYSNRENEETDSDKADSNDEVVDQENKEQSEETFEFRGLDGLREVWTDGELSKSKYGITFECDWSRRGDEAWKLKLTTFNFDAVHSDGQEAIEMLLAECGLPGIRELSEIANCETKTPVYGEWQNEWMSVANWLREPEDSDEESCYFSARFDEEKFLELLEGMRKKMPGDRLLFTYEE